MKSSDLQVDPGHLLVQNLQYIIKSLFFANVNPKNTAKVERAKKMIREYTGSDAQEHTRDQPICSEFLLRNVFYVVAQYTKEVDQTKGRQMIRDLCCWLSHAKAIDAKASTQPLEVILSIPSQQDFYTKWMFELNRMCFEEGNKLDNGSGEEIRRKRLEVLRVIDFTIPLLGKLLETVLVVILGILRFVTRAGSLLELVRY